MSWDDEDFEVPSTSTTSKIAESWEDEFADDEPVLESWEIDEEEVKPTAGVAKNKSKNGTKAGAKAATNAAIDLDTADEKTRKELLRRAELESDLNNAADLFGGLGVAEHPREKATKAAKAAKAAQPVITADTPIDAHPLFQPETKQDYEKLRKALAPAISKLATKSQLYYSSSLSIDLIRDVAKPMTTENIRKAISTLQVMLKEKEKEERQARLAKAGGTATGGAGKKKAKGRPNLGGAFKKDNDIAADNYDDFAEDDFM